MPLENSAFQNFGEKAVTSSAQQLRDHLFWAEFWSLKENLRWSENDKNLQETNQDIFMFLIAVEEDVGSRALGRGIQTFK